jgi:hypothetical protein
LICQGGKMGNTSICRNSLLTRILIEATECAGRQRDRQRLAEPPSDARWKRNKSEVCVRVRASALVRRSSVTRIAQRTREGHAKIDQIFKNGESTFMLAPGYLRNPLIDVA